MDWQAFPYSIPIWLSLIGSLTIVVLNFRRRSLPGAAPLVVLAGLTGVWSLFFGLELITAALTLKQIFESFQLVSGALGAAILWFVLEYTQPDRHFRRRTFSLLFAQPVVTFLLSMTNPFHHLLFNHAFLVESGDIMLLGYSPGFAVWVDVLFGAVFYLAALSLLAGHVFRMPPLYRKPALWVIGALVFPGVVSLVFLQFFTSRFMGDFVVVGFTVSAAILTLVVRSVSLSNIMPFAYDMLYQQLNQPVIIIDRNLKVIEINPACQRVLGSLPSQVIGTPVRQLFPGLDVSLKGVYSPTAQITLGSSTYWVHWSPIQSETGREFGWLLLLHDFTEQLRLNAALSSSEVSYRNLAEAINDGIVIVQDDRIVYVNGRLLEICGYTVDELLNHPFTDFLEPRDRASVNESYLRRLTGSRSTRVVDTTLLTKDGARRSIEYNGGVTNYQGRPAVVAYIRDISPRKQAEDELRRLSTAVEQNPAMILIANSAGLIEYVNPKFSEVTGYELQDVLGATPRLLNSGEKTGPEYQELWNTILSGNTWRGVFHNRKKNGELYWAEALISPIVNTEGKITQFLAIQEDITRRKAAEDALQVSQARLEAIFNNSQVGIGIVDTDGNFIQANQQLADLLGYSVAEMTSLSNLDITHPDDRERTTASFVELLQRRILCMNLEKRYIRKDRSIFWGEIASTPILNEDGRVVAAVGFLSDITERKHIEASEKRRIQELEALRATINDISAELELPRLLKAIVERVTALLDARDSELATYDENTQELKVVVSWLKGNDYTGTILQIGEGCMGRVAQTRLPLMIEDYAVWDGRSPQYDALHTSVLGVPLISAGRLLGVLAVGDDSRERNFSDRDVQLLEMFAQQAVIAIQNAELFSEVQRLATMDPLTNLLNRRSFFERAVQEFVRTRRYHDPLSVIMLDIDHFKSINDSFGHLTGDKALGEITKTCVSQIRSSDFVGRYGGEEFVVLLPETNLEGALSIAGRLCDAVRGVTLETQKGPVKVTASIGVAELSQEMTNLDTLIEHADAALYRAKQAGRDRISV